MSTGKKAFQVWRGRRQPGRLLLGAAILAFFMIVVPLADAVNANAATDMSTLVNKLVNKGVLSQDDANTILAQDGQSSGGNGKLPAWLKKLTISGDLRLRYEYLDVQDQSTPAINRGRFRYRLQLADQVTKHVKVVFGIASGGQGVLLSRSTNDNFGNGFQGHLPRIDMVYAQITPSKTVNIAVGKFPNPIWTPTMLTWDGNIRPDGLAVMITPPATGALDYFLNTDLFVLGAQMPPSGAEMPLMGVINPGVDLKFAQKDKIRLAAAYYIFDNIKRTYQYFNQLPANVNGIFHNVTGLNTSDSLDAKGNLLYNYNDFWFGAQADFGGLSTVVPYAGLYAEYINNPAPSSGNQGYIMGIKLGHAAVNKAGKWQINYNYRRLERNAWLDIFPNADIYFGSTNVEGNRAGFTYGLAKKMQAVVSYYNLKPIENLKPGDTANHTENTVQVDWMMEF